MRVALVSTLPPQDYAVGTYTLNLANNLPEKFDPHIVTYSNRGSSDSDNNGAGSDEDFKCAIHAVLRKTPIDYLVLGETLRRLQPSLLHAQIFNVIPILKTFPPEALSDIPLIVTIHEVPRPERFPHLLPYVRWLTRVASKIIYMSEKGKDDIRRLLGVSDEKLVKIPHGVDTVRYSPQVASAKIAESQTTNLNRLTVVSIGYLERRKGIEDAIAAIAKISHPDRTVDLLHVGAVRDTSYLDELRLLARLHRVETQISFTGFLPEEEFIRTLARADAVIFTHRFATQSGALLKGMALGKAVIAPAIPSFAEVIRPGENGVLYDPDNPASLAGHLLRVLSDSTLRDSLAANAQHTAARYDWRQIAAATGRLYEEVAG